MKKNKFFNTIAFNILMLFSISLDIRADWLDYFKPLTERYQSLSFNVNNYIASSHQLSPYLAAKIVAATGLLFIAGYGVKKGYEAYFADKAMRNLENIPERIKAISELINNEIYKLLQNVIKTNEGKDIIQGIVSGTHNISELGLNKDDLVEKVLDHCSYGSKSVDDMYELYNKAVLKTIANVPAYISSVVKGVQLNKSSGVHDWVPVLSKDAEKFMLNDTDKKIIDDYSLVVLGDVKKVSGQTYQSCLYKDFNPSKIEFVGEGKNKKLGLIDENTSIWAALASDEKEGGPVMVKKLEWEMVTQQKDLFELFKSIEEAKIKPIPAVYSVRELGRILKTRFDPAYIIRKKDVQYFNVRELSLFQRLNPLGSRKGLQ